MDDPELLQFRKKNKEMQEQLQGAFMLCEVLPFMKIFFRKQYNRLTNTIRSIIKIISDKYQEHLKDYEPGLVRDFSDALIEAKEEALAEGKESAPYLHNRNLEYALLDLFGGCTYLFIIFLSFDSHFISLSF
jgi:Cytochrome P450